MQAGTLRIGLLWHSLNSENLSVGALHTLRTIGSFSCAWVHWLARSVMHLTKVFATRHGLSTNFAQEMGYRDNLVEATDVALRLPYEPPTPGGPVWVGLNVSDLLLSGGYKRDNMFGLKADYPELVREIIRYFQAQKNCELHLVGHVVSRGQVVEDDRSAGLALAEGFPDAIVAPEFKGPSEAKAYIAGLDFFMGARMHACVAAFSSGVPVVPMAYSRKFAGLFGTLGYDHTADRKTDTAEEILARIKDGFENRDTLRTEAGLDRLGTYETAVRDLLAGVLERKS